MLTSIVLYTAYKHCKKSGENGDKEEPLNMKKYAKVILLCSAYMCVGPALILLNKYILSELNFHYPMFLSGLGVAVSAMAAHAAVALGYVQLQRKEQVEGALWYKRVLPVGLAHAGTLAFGNTVYLLLNVGFIQMLKSFTPVIIMITGVLAKVDNPNLPTILSIFIIAVGTAATCSFTPQLSIIGVIIMLLSEICEAIRLILTQFMLQDLKFGIWESQYVLAPATAFWLFFASAVYEGSDMYNNGAITIILDNPLYFFAASTMGLCVNFLSYAVIQTTSSLTMKVLGSVRNIFTIVIGIMFYGEVVTMQSAMGYSVTLGGIVAYNIAKSGVWDTVKFPQTLTNAIPLLARFQAKIDGWEAARLRSDAVMSAEKEKLVSSFGLGKSAQRDNNSNGNGNGNSSPDSPSSLSLSLSRMNSMKASTSGADLEMMEGGSGSSKNNNNNNNNNSINMSIKNTSNTGDMRTRKASYATGKAHAPLLGGNHSDDDDN